MAKNLLEIIKFNLLKIITPLLCECASFAFLQFMPNGNGKYQYTSPNSTKWTDITLTNTKCVKEG